MNWLIEQLRSNQLAAAGMATVAFSGALYFLRKLPSILWSWIERQVVLVVEIRQPDPLYTWFSHWLAAHPYVSRALDLSATTRGDSNEGERLTINYIPGLGRHFILHEGQWVYVSRGRDEAKGEGTLESLMEREHYEIRALRWSRRTVEQMLEAAKAGYVNRDGEGPDAWLGQSWGWQFLRRLPGRSLDSVVLPSGLAEGIVEHCRNFMESRSSYERRGVPWRTGILLYGPPGNGKTSFLAALATELGLDLAILNLSGSEMSDNGLLMLLSGTRNKLVVLEDVDALFDQREKKEASERISFSGFLNALDGVLSSEGMIVAMTTNHPERLDPALLRPGRVDLKIEVPLPSEEQLVRLFERFYPGQDGAHAFARRMAGSSMAAAQMDLQRVSRVGPSWGETE